MTETRINTNFCNTPLTSQEIDSSANAVSFSHHTLLTVLPNHSMNTDGELQGFMFSAHPNDSAQILPLSKHMCKMTCMYECKDQDNQIIGTPYNSQVLHVVNNLETYREALQEYITTIQNKKENAAGFDCIPVRSCEGIQHDDNLDFDVHTEHDQRTWAESVPDKVGLYHAWTRTDNSTFREHKLFIIVTGKLTQAAEEMHNLWLDTNQELNCKEFVNCEELNWLRRATQRNHSRIAADLSVIFDLTVESMYDLDDPTFKRKMLFPTISTIQNDVVECPYSGRIKLTDSAILPESSVNGVLFQMYSSEGFWIFHGPRDNATCYTFGGEFVSKHAESCFPTCLHAFNDGFHARHSSNVVSIARVSNASTIFANHVDTDKSCTSDHHDDGSSDSGVKYIKFEYPSEQFMCVLQDLGFNRNDGITNLMPLICYVADE